MKNENYWHNNEFIVNFFVDCGTVSRTEDAAGAGGLVGGRLARRGDLPIAQQLYWRRA